MSQFVLAEVMDSTISCISKTCERISALGKAINRSMCFLYDQVIKENNSQLSLQSQLLSDSDNTTLLNASKIVGLVDALKEDCQALKPLNEAVVNEFPEARNLSSYIRNNIISGNHELLESQKPLINNSLDLLNNIVKKQHKILDWVVIVVLILLLGNTTTWFLVS